MKIDAYTKAVLTVIAACLVWMCATRDMPVAQAQAGLPQPTAVVLVDAQGTPLNTQDGLRVNLDTKGLPVVIANVPVPVEVRNTSLNVAVRALQRTGAWDPLQVQVLRDPPTLRPVP